MGHFAFTDVTLRTLTLIAAAVMNDWAESELLRRWDMTSRSADDLLVEAMGVELEVGESLLGMLAS